MVPLVEDVPARHSTFRPVVGVTAIMECGARLAVGLQHRITCVVQPSHSTKAGLGFLTSLLHSRLIHAAGFGICLELMLTMRKQARRCQRSDTSFNRPLCRSALPPPADANPVPSNASQAVT